MAAERSVVETELVPDLVVNRLRDADGARMGESLKPGGDVDPIAEDIVAVDNHIAEVDADPKLETAIRRQRVIDRARGPLHFNGAVQRIDDARKIRQQAVTGRADDPSAVRGDQRVDGAAELAEGSMRAGLVLAHKPAETGHVRVQDGRKLSLPSRSLLRNIRRVVEQGAHRGCV